MELLSVGDVARTLKVSEQYVRFLVREKALEGKRVGKQWIVEKKDLLKFIEKTPFVIEPEDHPRLYDELPEIVSLSFFSGAMGLDLGLEKEGISPLLACEYDKETRKTIQANKPNIALIGDIGKYTADKILEYAKIPKEHPIDAIFGGPPCQAFSTAGKQRGFEDERGNVFLTFINLAIELNPKYLVIENVRGLLSAKYPPKPKKTPIKGGALYYVINLLKKAGYAVSFELYNAANFGAAQIRERVIMICKKGEQEVDFLSPTNAENGAFNLPPWKTIGDVIGDLDLEHHYVKFPEKRLQYYRLLKAGQNWRDLPPHIQPVAMGRSYYLQGGKTGFYRRLSFNRPSPTLVTHPAMPATDLCHPVEDRPLSIEEYRRIQGFPDSWTICGSLLDIYRQLGNAVPIPLGQAVGRTIMADIKGEKLPQFKGFPYSRYRNTSHKEFISQLESL